MLSQTVQLQIRDHQSKPLSFAHVLINDIHHKALKTYLSDKDGAVNIEKQLFPNHKRVIVQASYVGFTEFLDTVDLDALSDYTLRLEPSPYALDQIVVTAQYAPGNIEQAVHKIKVIDRKRIEEQGAVNLRDVLRNEQNIRLSQDNILGSSMSMQGVSGQNIKILMDGVPVIGRLGGNIDISQINLNNIERIEIVEGPLSVSYGTDALGGTINLISKKSQKRTFEGSLSSYYESVGQYNLDGVVGWKKGKHLWSLSGGRNYFDGWSNGDDFFKFPKPRLADTSRTEQWNPKEQYFGKAQYTTTLGQFKLRPYVEYFSEKITNKGYPRAPYYETAFDDYYFTLRQNAGIDLSGEIMQHKNLTISAAYNDYGRIKNTFFKDLTTLNEELSENTSDQDTSRFKSYMSRATLSTSKDSSSINYELGYDINYEETLGRRIEGIEKNQGNFAGFASAQWVPLEGFTMRPGIRYGHNTVYDHPVLPSLNVKYKLRRSFNTITIRASYARGFRAPDLKELYFEFVDINHNIVGNGNLNAETSSNYTLNATWQRVIKQTILKIELGGYFNDISNLITLAQGEGTQYTYINVGKYKTHGLTGNAYISWDHLTFNFGGAYIGFYNDLDAQTASVSQFNYSPELRSNFTYDIHKWVMSFSAFYKYTGVRRSFSNISDEIEEIETAAFQMLDVTMTKRFWQDRISISVGGKNLFNITDVQQTGITGGVHSSSTGAVPMSWGRSVFTTLTFKFY